VPALAVTASTPTAQYPPVEVNVPVSPTGPTRLPFIVYLPKLDTAHPITLPLDTNGFTTQEMKATTPTVPLQGAIQESHRLGVELVSADQIFKQKSTCGKPSGPYPTVDQAVYDVFGEDQPGNADAAGERIQRGLCT